MIGRWFHPSFKNLNLFHDRELPERKRRRVAAHLADCPKCRDTIQFLRKIDEAARSYPMRDPGADLFRRIMDRRESGERIILPMIDPPPPEPRRSLKALLVGGLAAGVVVAGLALGLPELRANRSELVFEPATPRAGETIKVEYRAGTLLSGADRLVLRARYLPADAPSHGRGIPQVVATELARVRGRYTGEFQLPPDVVYATFAVENAAGTAVDYNRRRPAELLQHDETGRPTFAALRKRFDESFGRNDLLARETAELMTAAYPDLPTGWLSRFHVERAAVSGVAEQDSLARDARARVRHLENSLLHRADLPPEELSSLAELASLARDAEAADRWRRRLSELDPAHPTLIQHAAVTAIGPLYNTDPAAALDALLPLWRDDLMGAGAVFVAQQAYLLALRAGNPEETRRWARIYVDLQPWEDIAIGEVLADTLGLNAHGVAMLRGGAERLSRTSDQDRPLALTRPQHEVAKAGEARRADVGMGRALLGQGKTWQGLDMLELASEQEWSPAVFRLIADTRLALSDTVQALQSLARLAADPATPLSEADSLRRFATERVQAHRWEGWVARAQEQLRNRVLESAVMKPLPAGLQVVDVNGETHILSSLTAGSVAVVAFWTRQGHSVRELPVLQSLARQLESREIPFLALTAEPISAELVEFLEERGFTFTVYHDPAGSIAEAFSQTVLPEYHVLDAAGWVRFEQSRAGEILRQVVALQQPDFLAAAAESPGHAETQQELVVASRPRSR